MKGLLAKIGIHTKRDDPAVLFIGQDESDFTKARALIDKFCTPEIRLSAVLLCLDARASHALLRHFPMAIIAVEPTGGSVAVSALLSTLKVRAVIGLAQLPDVFVEATSKRGTPVLSQDRGTDDSEDDLMQKIIRLVGQERKWEERGNRPIGRFFAEKLFAKLQRNDGQIGFGGQIKRLPNLHALKSRLGDPETIMCLGNGPSSEDAQLSNMPYDALFRANHVWMKRGFLDQPDVVFTGMQASMKKIKDAVLVVLGDTTEKVLLMVRAVNFLNGHLTYAVVDGTNGSGGIIQLKAHKDFRPTSGAIMLAVAVALQPKRLIIAGMDMFRHSEGAYPGDKTTTNAYTATHDHDHELAFIMEQLERFSGELTIVSPILKSEWENHQRVR